MIITNRDHHLITRALALAIEIYSRATPTNVPKSDAEDMAMLYLRITEEDERRGHEWGVGWLLSGGLDLRGREMDPLPHSGGPPPEPAPGGGERAAA